MTPEEALQVLDAHSPPGENWPLHSRQVARVALRLCEALAAAGAPVDAEALEVQALLHDIGRSRTHGPLHGWTGYTLLKSMGLAAEARGCLTHWLKGRDIAETARSGGFQTGFLERVFAELKPPEWTLGDCVMSVADSCVQHSTIVSLTQRHHDLLTRYGPSDWMQRAMQLAEEHARRIGAKAGIEVELYLAPLYGDCLQAAEPGS